jgi:hypothetical protein
MTPDYSFQADVIAETERAAGELAREKVLLVSPTGSGKTVMGSTLSRRANAALTISVSSSPTAARSSPRPPRSFSSTGFATASSRPASILARWSWCRWRRSQRSSSAA